MYSLVHLAGVCTRPSLDVQYFCCCCGLTRQIHTQTAAFMLSLSALLAHMYEAMAAI